MVTFIGSQVVFVKRRCNWSTRLILGCLAFLLLLSVFFVDNQYLLAVLREHLRVKPDQLLSAQTRPQTIKPNAAPFMIYRNEKNKIQLCVIPRVCSVEYIGGKKEFHLPIEYKPFEKMIQHCLIYPYSKLTYYQGEKPERPDVTYFNVDVLGHSLLSMWDAHFAHFIHSVTRRVLAPASLLRTEAFATLPQPRCFYPNSNGSTPCGQDQQNQLQPRILVSRMAFSYKWIRGFLKLVESGVTDGKGPLLRVLERKRLANEDTLTKRIECYRSLITTPHMFSTSIAGHDRLLRNAKVERTPKCFSRVLLLTRVPYIGRFGRSIPDDTIAALRTEVNRLSDVEIEWKHGLTRTNFSQQVAMFQRADVVVTVHGAELSNALFLRRGARVIELFPFGHHTTFFYYTTVNSVNAKHVGYGTRPDPEPFYACLKQRGLYGKGFKARFDKFAAQYRNATTFQQRNKAASFFVGFGRVEGCVKSQVIRFDPTELAQIIARQARERCEQLET